MVGFGKFNNDFFKLAALVMGISPTTFKKIADWPMDS